jgi:hypothetical protein
LKKVEVVLVILNAIFGFIQIFFTILFLDFWMSLGIVLMSVVALAFGYSMIIESRFKKINAHLLWGVILLLGNLLVLSILGLDIVNNSGAYAIQLDLVGFMLITFADFEGLGNLIIRIRGIHE